MTPQQPVRLQANAGANSCPALRERLAEQPNRNGCSSQVIQPDADGTDKIIPGDKAHAALAAAYLIFPFSQNSDIDPILSGHSGMRRIVARD
jgi:hypothetical protein